MKTYLFAAEVHTMNPLLTLAIFCLAVLSMSVVLGERRPKP